MTTQTLTLRHQTKIAVNVIIEDDTGVLVCSILLITRLFAYLWRVSQVVIAIKRELFLLVNDFKAALNFTIKVFAIGFNSLVYGLGVTL